MTTESAVVVECVRNRAQRRRRSPRGGFLAFVSVPADGRGVIQRAERKSKRDKTER